MSVFMAEYTGTPSNKFMHYVAMRFSPDLAALYSTSNVECFSFDEPGIADTADRFLRWLLEVHGREVFLEAAEIILGAVSDKVYARALEAAGIQPAPSVH